MAYNPFGTPTYGNNQSVGQPSTPAQRSRQRFMQNNSFWQSLTGQNVASTPATQTYAQRATPELASSFYGPTQPVQSAQNQSLDVYGPSAPTTRNRPASRPSFAPPSKVPAASSASAFGVPQPATPSAQQLADQRGLTGNARQQFIESSAGITGAPKTEPTYSLQGGPSAELEAAAPAVSPLQSMYDTAQKKYDEARQKFLASSSSEDLANLQRQLADYQTATAQAVSGEEGQGRGKTTSLVRGRQALLQEQRGLGEQNLLSQIDITSDIINREQSAAYQALGFAKEDLDNIREQVLAEGKTNFGEIKEFGDQLLRIAPDGTVSVLAQRAAEAAKPITVSAGQTVIDPNTGEVIFQAGEKPEALPSSIQEYMFATQQGYTGTYNDFKNQSSSTAGKALSAEASKLIANANSGLSAIQTMLQTVDSNLGRGALGNLTNREYKAAEANLVDIIGRMRSGGAITTDEAARFQQLLPSVIDTDVLARKKLQDIQSLLNETIAGVQGSTQAIPAPTNPQNQMYYNLLQGGQITPEEYQELTGSFSNDLSMSQNGSMGNIDNTQGLPSEMSQFSSAFGKGTITGYGSNFWKPGLDFVLPGGKNADVKLPANAKIVAIRPESQTGGFGNQVKVEFPDGKELWISHLDKFGNLQVGQTYGAGTVIGKQGNTGRTYGQTGIHLDLTMPKPGGGYYTAEQVAAYLRPQSNLS